jgi:hypothetical protein
MQNITAFIECTEGGLFYKSSSFIRLTVSSNKPTHVMKDGWMRIIFLTTTTSLRTLSWTTSLRTLSKLSRNSGHNSWWFRPPPSLYVFLNLKFVLKEWYLIILLPMMPPTTGRSQKTLHQIGRFLFWRDNMKYTLNTSCLIHYITFVVTYSIFVNISQTYKVDFRVSCDYFPKQH